MTNKTIQVFKTITSVPNSNKTWLNKLEYVAYYKDNVLSSISKHQVKDNLLTIKNYRLGQHGFKKALSYIT
tara:strand:+ start:276 stop:488 length:213 start_codon:yes stop_codon:yes gene_type:complete